MICKADQIRCNTGTPTQSSHELLLDELYVVLRTSRVRPDVRYLEHRLEELVEVHLSGALSRESGRGQ